MKIREADKASFSLPENSYGHLLLKNQGEQLEMSFLINLPETVSETVHILGYPLFLM